MKNISSGLLIISSILMFIYAVMALLRLAGTAVDRRFHGYIRKIRLEHYMQSVLLPLYGAVVGGFFSTGVAVLVDAPPGSSLVGNALLGTALIVAAIGFGVMFPLKAYVTYENRTEMLIGLRIDELRNGDWTRDTKADVLRTIEQDKAAVEKNLADLNPLFLTLLAFLIAADAIWLISHYRMHTLVTGVETIVVLVALSGIAARYWIWPRAWRNALAELDSYQSEANRLSPPAPAKGAAARDPRHHDLWVAAGGLIIGAVLTRAGGGRRPRSGGRPARRSARS